MRILPAWTLTIGLLSSPALCASFASLCDYKLERETGCSIRMSGPIQRGDANKLVEQLGKPAPHLGLYRSLILDSPGGDVQEAFKLAQIVRTALLQTTTYRAGDLDFHVCASACFLVWAAGAQRQHHTDSKSRTRGPLAGKQPYGLGLHRPYFSSDGYSSSDANQVAARQQELGRKVFEYLHDEGIPASLIEEMMRRSSREILWLDHNLNYPMIHLRPPWFEELLIARCGYDPVQDKAAEAADTRAMFEDPAKWVNLHESDPQQKKAIAERMRVNGCLYYEIMIPAQLQFRKRK